MYNIAMTIDDSLTSKKIYRFAEWQFDPTDGRLQSEQKSLRLQPRLSQLLLLLVTNNGLLLSRKELITAIWQNKFVNEDALSRCVAELRSALGDNRAAPIYIETVPKKGYRFIPDVSINSPSQAVTNSRRSYFKYGFLVFTAALCLAVFLSQQIGTPDHASQIKSALLAAQRITTDKALEYQPELSNLKDMLAYSVLQDQKLKVIVLDTQGETLFDIRDPIHHLFSATFSPDDEKLLVAGKVKQACSVFLYHLPSLQREKIASCVSSDSSGLFDWSGDGAYLAYVNHSSPSKSDGAGVAAIWHYDVSSKQHRQLTFPTKQHTYDSRPRFSPDGKSIAFTRGGASIRNLYLADFATADTLDTPVKLTEQRAFITSFNWLQDSQQLIYDSNVLGDRNLWLLDINSQHSELLGARDAQYPSLNKGNTRLAFQEVRYNANIWQLDLSDDTQTPTAIIQSIKYNNFPSYSPDGKQIAFVSNRKGKAAIWLYSFETKRQKELLSIKEADLVLPNWSFDGKYLLVSSHDSAGYRCYQVNVATKLYQPLHSITQQYHGCQYSANGDVYAISKQPSEKSGLIKITNSGDLIKVNDDSVGRMEVSRDSRLVYSLEKANGLYSVDTDGLDKRVLVGDFASQLDGHWAVQGDYLYYPKLGANKGIWRLSIDTGEEHRVTEVLPTAIGATLAVSPDHKQLIFSQTDGRQADIYVTQISND